MSSINSRIKKENWIDVINEGIRFFALKFPVGWRGIFYKDFMCLWIPERVGHDKLTLCVLEIRIFRG